MSSHPVHGTVLSWDDESGWGVLTSPEAPGEVWAHFSAVHMEGFASLEPGEAVIFTWEESEQDGYSFRAVGVRRPGDPEIGPDEGTGDGFESDVRIEFDPE
ncbi:cold-shock protein [Spirillospora sp. NPDC048911]|uniref:cold-shock protein n=1 Tax=Spirillospora sp. NPDC048911 TaxID=3364527 RepID=UPI00371D6D50